MAAKAAALIFAGFVASAAAGEAIGGANAINDYPTAARADYVFACMAVNGQNQVALRQCSCSVDHVAHILSYERYVEAETVLRTLQVTGERVAALRGSARHERMVEDLRRAQAEADILCF